MDKTSGYSVSNWPVGSGWIADWRGEASCIGSNGEKGGGI